MLMLSAETVMGVVGTAHGVVGILVLAGVLGANPFTGPVVLGALAIAGIGILIFKGLMAWEQHEQLVRRACHE